MGALILPSRFVQQPTQPPQVDRQHPLAGSLFDVWLPAISTRGLLRGTDSTTTASTTMMQTARGQGINTISTGRRYPANDLNGKPVAWLVVAYRNGNSTNSSIVRKDGTVTPMQEFSGQVRSAVFNSGGGFVSADVYGNASDYANKVSTFCGVFNSSESVIFSNGGPNIAANPLTVAGGGGQPLCFGATESGGELATNWTLLYIAMWSGNGVPTSSQLRELSRNEYSLFKAPPRKLWVASAVTDSPAAQLAWTEDSDLASISGTATDRSSIAWTEQGDSETLVGTITDRAALSWTEQGDSFLITATSQEPPASSISVSVAWAEAGDTAALVGRLTNRSALGMVDQGDSWSVMAVAATRETPAAMASVVNVYTIMSKDPINLVANLGAPVNVIGNLL